MLTEKDYCDKDLSLALKELGCPLSSFEKWENKNEELELVPHFLLYSAQKWLREEKGIFVYVDAPWKTDEGLGWNYFCCNKPMTEEDKEVCFASGGFYDSYEEALLKGVKNAVKKQRESEVDELIKSMEE